MEVIAGDETGLVKLVNIATKSYLSYGEEQSRLKAVKAIIKLSDDEGTFPVAVLRASGVLEAYRYNHHSLTSLGKSLETGITNPIGAFSIHKSNIVTTYNENGDISLLNYSTSDDDDMSKSSFTWNDSEDTRVNFKVSGPISAADCTEAAAAAFAGRENDVQVYDVSTQQSVWQARNVPHDSLGLRVPVWVTCLKFGEFFFDMIINTLRRHITHVPQSS